MAGLTAVLLGALLNRSPFASAYSATFVIRHEYRSPDCVDKLVGTINGQFPGPTITVQPGEQVVIDVVNSMRSDAVSMHWHGMLQTGTPWQDGAAMISGCPIPPMTNWTYSFRANDKPGTYLYHAHLGALRQAGLGGVLIIAGDVSPHAAEATGGDVTLKIDDWYHATSDELVANLLEPRFRWPGDPQSILINGKGHFNCSANGVASPHYRPGYHPPKCDEAECPGYEVVSVAPGETYLFRFVNGGSLSLFNVAIQGHSMTVVEVDGTPTEKYNTSSVDVQSGQRVSVLVTADQAPDVYVLRVRTRFRSGVRVAYTMLEYAGSPVSPASLEPSTVEFPQPEWNDNNFTFDFQNAIKGLYTGPTAIYPAPNHSEVARTFVMLGTQERMLADSTHNGNPSVDDLAVAHGVYGVDHPQDFCDSAGNTKPLRWLLGRRSWTFPDTPVLSKLYFNIGMEDISEEALHYQVEVGRVYDIVIQNFPACNGVCETHAWHLHGNKFWVLGTGRGMWTGSEEQVAMLNTTNPPLRDVTQSVSEGVDNRPFAAPADYTGCGWTAIRFRVAGPGAWFFHCHQSWHIVMGSNAIFYTPPDTIPAPPENLLTCGRMTARALAGRLAGGGTCGGDGGEVSLVAWRGLPLGLWVCGLAAGLRHWLGAAGPR